MKQINIKTFAVSILATVLLSACATTGVNVNTQEKTNKQKAVELLNSLETGDKAPIAYINPNKYIQHNLMVKDGLAGFGEFLSHVPKGSIKVDIKRAFQDGDYVFTHTKYNFFGPKAGFNIFRFEDGKIVEHWDNLEVQAPANLSGHTQFDGATQIKDLDKTQQNKALVKNFVTDILLNREVKKLKNYIDPNFTQHHIGIADGIKGLKAFRQYRSENNLKLKFDRIEKVLGEGNFVLTVSHGAYFKNNDVSFYDLFRVENGKIVEHWDVIENILPEEKRQNTNGKFNFK